MERTILIVTGLPGAGKTFAAEMIKEAGVPMFRTGQAVKDAVAKRMLPYTIKNSEMIARELREKVGPDAPARITGEERIKPFWKKHPDENMVCVEGPRDMHEVNYLSTLGRVIIIIIEAPLEMRFRRLSSRKESRDPKDQEEMEWRDKREMERGLEEVITTKKYPRVSIQNTGTLEELREKIKRFLEEMK